MDYLWISFEGAKKNHEMLRGKGTYDKAIETLQLIKKYYKGKTAIRMSINKYNIGDMKEILRIAEKYNVDLIRFTPLLEFGRAEGRDLVINQNQYIEFLKLVKQLKSNTTEIIYPNMPNEKIWIGSNGFGCHCGKEAIWITETGDVYPCIFWGDKYKIGNIKENAYSDLWTRSIISSKIETNNVCDSCSNYKLCRAGCRARSLFRYNDLKHVDPLCPLRKNIEEKELL